MHLRQLETFVAIVESGTLTEAARRLYKTQGAVSHDLKALEAELGVMLIDRSGQRIRVTHAGEALLPAVRDVLRRLGDVQAVSRKLRQGRVGVIRVGTLPSLGPFLLPLLTDFRRDHSEVRFMVFTELQSVLADWLTDGRLDLVVAQTQFSATFRADAFDSEDGFVVVPASDSLAKKERVSLRDVVDRPFIGFVHDLQSTRLTEQFFRPLGRYPDAVIEVEDFRLMSQLIRAGFGIGLMPASAIIAQGDEELAALRPDPPLSRSLTLLTDRRDSDNPSVELLREYILEHWRTPSYPPAKARSD